MFLRNISCSMYLRILVFLWFWFCWTLSTTAIFSLPSFFSPSFLPSCSVVLSFFPLSSRFPLSILYDFPLLCPSSSLLFYSVLSWSLFSLSLCVFSLLVFLSLSFSLLLFPLSVLFLLIPLFPLFPLFPLAFLSLFLHTLPLFAPPPLFFSFAFPYCFLPSQHLPFCSLLSWSLFFSISFCLCVAPLTYSLQVICSLSLPISSNLISPSCNLTITFLFFSFLPLYQWQVALSPLFSRYLFCCTLQPCIFLLTLLNGLPSVFSVFIYLIF